MGQARVSETVVRSQLDRSGKSVFDTGDNAELIRFSWQKSGNVAEVLIHGVRAMARKLP